MDQPNSDRSVSAKIEFSLGGRSLSLSVQVPAGPASPLGLLPLARALTDAAVDSAVQAQSEAVSCAKGCGACCRQLVPVSTVEAQALYEHVQAMDEPRRSVVVERFDSIRQTLERVGYLQPLRDLSAVQKDDLNGVARGYFKLWMPCPFLEDESCSVHPVRPLVCREYLVTSDPEHCRSPEPTTVRRIPIETRISRGLPALAAPPGTPGSPWIPLVLLLEWGAANRLDSSRTGPQMLQAMFESISGADVPDPPSLGGNPPPAPPAISPAGPPSAAQ